MTSLLPGEVRLRAGPAHPGLGNLPQREVIHTVHMSTLVKLLDRSLSRDEEAGQGLAEYALILGLIAVVAIVALLFLGGQVSDKLSVIGGTLQSHAP